MHLGIEASRLLKDRRGIGRYVRNVLQGIASLAPGMPVTVFVRGAADIDAMRQLLVQLLEPPGNTTQPGLAATWRIVPVSALPFTAVDVVWYPWNFITTRTARAAMVVSTLDLAPMLRFDHRWWKWPSRQLFRRRYLHTVRDASAILTISQASKAELVSVLYADPSRVHVTLLAADDLQITAAEATAPLDRAGVTGAFFLTVGAQEARKNLSVVYDAMAQLHARGIRVPLVQCGPALSKQTKALHGTAPWLHHVGYVRDDELITLYRRATALVFPSRYEGFGLPVAEAMHVGGRVICANSSSLPEVAGDAALYFAWDNATELAAHMQRLLTDDTLRDTLTTRGAARAATWSWQQVAEQSLAVFTNAAARFPQRA